MFAVMTRKLIPTRTVVQDFLSITPYFMSIALSEQFELLRPNAFGDALLTLAISPVLREGAFDERQRNMVGPTVVYKGRIDGPIDSGNWPGCKFKVERRYLVN